MRRIIHNTTAIAASLALLAPQFAMAEQRLPNAQVEQQREVRAENMPRLAAILQEEIEKGLTVEGLRCANGDVRPCANNVRLLTPRGVTVQVSQSGILMLAPSGQQVNAVNPQGKLVPRGKAAAAAPTLAPVKAAPEQSGSDRAANMLTDAADAKQAADDQAAAEAARLEARMAAEADARKAAEAAAKAEARAADQAAKAQQQAAARARKDAEKAAEKAAQDAAAAAAAAAQAAAAAKPAPVTQAQAEPSLENALADALGKVSGGQTSGGQTAGDTVLRMAEDDTAQKRNKAMPGLARVLGQEVDAGLSRSQLICQSGEAPPCAEGVALMTPRGVAVGVGRNGTVGLAAVQRQVNIVNQAGEVVPRAPEANTVETAAAQEAAKEASAPAAAALEAAEGAGNVVAEQQVTEANTRSSAEDFEASLRDALAQASGATPTQQQNAAAADDGDDNDLAKALILGLGAVAVGQMLDNNRQVALSTPDRVVVQRADGSQEVIKDEVALLRQPGSTVTTEDFDDGSSRTIVTREDGSKVVTIRDADLRVLRRTLISADGTRTMLIDDTADVQPVDVARLPAPAQVQTTNGTLTEEQLRDALSRESSIDRRFTLGQIRNIPEVRALVAPVNIDAITFDTGSAAINPNQAQQLASLGRVIQDAVARNPREVFMIEGHTDTVGAGAMNLALSDRRAESVALALAEYFDVPPENMVVQGYGEQFLKVRSEGDIRANRRASVRRITELLQTAQAN